MLVGPWSDLLRLEWRLLKRSYAVQIPAFSFRLLVPHIRVLHSFREFRGSGCCLRTLQNYAKREAWDLHSHLCQ